MNEMSDNKKIYISLDPSYQTLEVWSYLNDLQWVFKLIKKQISSSKCSLQIEKKNQMCKVLGDR